MMNMKIQIKQLFGKKPINNILLIIGFVITFGGFVYFWRYQRIHPPYTTKINKVLQQAGNNRKELEKVLTHYSHNSADSLKLRAAEFLIENMPGKYSISYDAPWESVATVCLRWTSSSNKQLVLDTYHTGKQIVREDIRYITAEYLLANIESAFKVWREMPWCKHVSFDIFCEEILPYRVDAEPLENWREKVLIGFADLYNELRNAQSMTVIEACGKVNAWLPQFRIDKDFPPMNYSTLMASSRNSCVGMAALAIFAMRALGIPVTLDSTPRFPYAHNGHSWNSVCDSAGKHISFMGAESDPGESHQGTDSDKSKVYRRMFALQNPIQTNKVHIPPELRQDRLQDVSSEYIDCANIDVPVRFQPVVSTGYAYLATLFCNTNVIWWTPVAWGQVQGQYIHYDMVGKKLLYLPVYYANNQQTPAEYPFYLDSIGNMQFFEPDMDSFRQHVFYESGIGDTEKVITGTTYELLYWSGTEWLSLGKQTAKDASLFFRIPDNALLYLRTIDETDNNFSVFSIRDNKQNWLFK
jgi:hypothetical protein